MDEYDDQTRKALLELAELHKSNPTAFRGLVRLWVIGDSLGILGVAFKNILLVLAVIIGAWLAFKGWVWDVARGDGP